MMLLPYIALELRNSVTRGRKFRKKDWVTIVCSSRVECIRHIPNDISELGFVDAQRPRKPVFKFVTVKHVADIELGGF